VVQERPVEEEKQMSMLTGKTVRWAELGCNEEGQQKQSSHWVSERNRGHKLLGRVWQRLAYLAQFGFEIILWLPPCIFLPVPPAELVLPPSDCNC
jgi:hypothetical protein